ncbi:MAG: tyrosine-protein phosphatase, partial [Proteobacteria bacterium]|nr:tyrosine-protein phosphatase [Pseudomonadota bacterium]
LHDTKLYSRNAPRVQEIKALGALFEQIEYPALMHCKSGADRAGLGAALYRILHLGHPVADAAAELNWRYGHFKKARTGVLDFFFASYLAETASDPVDFLTWLETRYDADALHAKFRAEGWSSLLVDKVLHRE